MNEEQIGQIAENAREQLITLIENDIKQNGEIEIEVSLPISEDRYCHTIVKKVFLNEDGEVSTLSIDDYYDEEVYSDSIRCYSFDEIYRICQGMITKRNQ